MEWIDEGAWNGFMEMRRAIKKPMTERAISMLIHRLERLKENGHDVNACLDQSTFNNWQDVYPLKDKDIPNMRRETYQGEPRMTKEEWVRSKAVREKVFGKIKLVRSA